MFGFTEVLLLLVLGVVLLLRRAKQRDNFPPGPRGLPIIGNALQIGEYPHLKFSEWANQYGRIYTIRLGMNMAVVVNDLKLFKDMMSDTNFSARPHMEFAEMLVGGPYGIVTTNGRTWEEQRRWCLRTLRDFGFGKTSMEGLIMDEVNDLMATLEKKDGAPISMNHVLDLAVLNALWAIINGERSETNDPKMREVLNSHHDIFPALHKTGLFLAPWLKYIFPGALKVIERASDIIMTFSRNAVSAHWDTWREGETRDFIDKYISEIKRTTDPSSSFYGDLGRTNLDAVVSDFIQAGSETTSYTVAWALCYLTEYPEIQGHIQSVIDKVVGSGRAVSLSDKASMPIIDATILETLRLSSLVANGVPRAAIETKTVDGYTIPKGTWVIPNMYHVHHDPSIWGDAEKFRPDRFLLEDGSKLIRHEALIPFQYGRRQCIGESLAKDTAFLFLANVLQRFSVDRVEKEPPKVEFGGPMLIPKAYNFTFKPRS